MSRHLVLASVFGLLFLFMLGNAGQTREAECQNSSLGETEADCPWAGTARQLQSAAKASQPLTPILERATPDLLDELKSDSKLHIWKELWGQSINYDELAHGLIVDPSILAELSKYFEAPRPKPPATPDGKPVVHAGLEHTYGYLFSLLQTPFGYKRARWVKGESEQGFGLPAGLLGPRPSQGTLFGNVTYFAGRIAFRSAPEALRFLKREEAAAPKALQDYDYKSLKCRRLVESVSWKDGLRSRTVQLRTDLVAYPHPSGSANSYWLVYSVADSAQPSAQLITAFPVEKSFVERIFDPAGLGPHKPVTTRYNAYVDGLTGRPAISGERFEKENP